MRKQSTTPKSREVIESIPMVTAVLLPDDGFEKPSASKQSPSRNQAFNTSSNSSDGKQSPSRNQAFTSTPTSNADDERRELNASSFSTKPMRWPKKLQKEIVETFGRSLNEQAGRAYLTKHHWPSGLQNALIKSCQRFPIRFFIVDDSGSMSTNDGCRVAGEGNQAR